LTKLQILLFPITTQNSRKRKAKPFLHLLCDLLLLHRARSHTRQPDRPIQSEDNERYSYM